MIPETASAVLGLLLVIGPGLLFEAVREQRRPVPTRSVFREASTVALASLVFATVAIAILAMVREAAPTIVADPRDWIVEGSGYVADHFGRVVGSVAALAVISFGLAFLSARLMYRGGADIKPSSTGWFEVLRERVPDGTEPMVRVQLHDGTEFIGLVMSYSANVLHAEREITLGPPLQRSTGAGAFELLPDGGAWERVVIPGSSIQSLWVRYARTDRAG